MAPVESGQRGTPASGNPKTPLRESRCGGYPHPHAWEGIPTIDAVAAEVAAHQPIPHPPLRRLKNRMVVPSQRVRSGDRTVTAPDPSGPHATIPATTSVLSCSAALCPDKRLETTPAIWRRRHRHTRTIYRNRVLKVHRVLPRRSSHASPACASKTASNYRGEHGAPTAHNGRYTCVAPIA